MVNEPNMNNNRKWTQYQYKIKILFVWIKLYFLSTIISTIPESGSVYLSSVSYFGLLKSIQVSKNGIRNKSQIIL